MDNGNKGFVNCDETPDGNHAHLVFRDIGSRTGEDFPLVLLPAHSLSDPLSAKSCKVGCGGCGFWHGICPRVVQPLPYRFCCCAPWCTHIWNVDCPVTFIRNDLKR